jgi:hypothetical protein
VAVGPWCRWQRRLQRHIGIASETMYALHVNFTRAIILSLLLLNFFCWLSIGGEMFWFYYLVHFLFISETCKFIVELLGSYVKYLAVDLQKKCIYTRMIPNTFLYIEIDKNTISNRTCSPIRQRCTKPNGSLFHV